ncbi:hypothetical protein B0H65DRAFT_469552 [Neurospora tetraspora]|uniref:C2H2-type domain-containing protein n=1 Tax=Neurospora tetraspora TaxID=94610 RepID=A0AAE0JCV8_9PEZI|nr:hypothetical protein B0H65DRAFT_469552 [Neurospora tetraspora]
MPVLPRQYPSTPPTEAPTALDDGWSWFGWSTLGWALIGLYIVLGITWYTTYEAERIWTWVADGLNPDRSGDKFGPRQRGFLLALFVVLSNVFVFCWPVWYILYGVGNWAASLRWYCLRCDKFCCDENGYKMHCQSPEHTTAKEFQK